MIIFPAIDLYGGKAVRLIKGDYEKMTVYSDDPLAVAKDFVRQGATHVHMVDLAGARDGGTPHLDVVARVARETPLFVEIGGGIRNMETAGRYLAAGIDRVILGTAAATDPAFLAEAVAAFGKKVAVGADVRDGRIAVKGWRETSAETLDDFMARMEKVGVSAVICTDISRDGMMGGANIALYKELSEKYRVDITASGGVSGIDDIRKLKAAGLAAAIIGKAYYTGAIDIKAAVGEAEA